MTAEHPERRVSAEQDGPTHPTRPLPPEPADVDELLAESLRAQSEKDFTWKEPERGPRWFERAEQEAALTSAGPAEQTLPAPSKATAATGGHGPDSARRRRASGPRVGGAVFAAIAVALALWVLASVVLGIYIDWLIIALGVCGLAGLVFVAAGLMPKPGSRI
ncbi:hypothetical protein [Nesterenkonia sp. Act20]|uniref:hypothetical protein n=1 Tax=Nesterenkonia sp. Act20 TaxID=1483432 RepID=UPI001C48B8F1|nr:hypothetical protein [Nesterenkonia sp. Act20]